MRVLLVDVNCKHSSTGNIVYDLYTALRDDSHAASVCYGRGPIVREPDIFKFGLDAETCFHAFLTRVTGYTGCFSPISTARLLRQIKKFRPDVVHLHELHAYFINYAPLIRYLKRSGIPVVMTLHCEFNYTGKCGHAVACDQWMTECGNCPHLHDYPRSLLFDRTKDMFRRKKALFADWQHLTVTAPSDWLAKRAKQSFLGTKDIRVIHNGIDTEVFYPRDASAQRRALGIADGEQVVLAAAPDLMSQNKGGRYVLRLAERMSRPGLRFVLVGADAAACPMRERVTVLPRTYDIDVMAQYYSMADVFVICSERETYPTSCLEALCCGTPVAGFAVGGVAETAWDDAALCDYGDIAQLAECVAALLSHQNSDTRREIADAAAKRCGKSAMTKQYLALYREHS
ncbi:MAG: glycosyltransferase [Ruminococcaceae bacterium]|nr:glycosyltransferase [Oscillospiraceae bacterium]